MMATDGQVDDDNEESFDHCFEPYGALLMLVGHLVPAYFAIVTYVPEWNSAWSRLRRVALYVAAYASTVTPDFDVICNAIFRGIFGHTYLWTHSLFLHLGVAIIWWMLRRIGCWPYLQTMIGLIAVGGLSHLALDVVAHSTPLLYPVSMYMFGAPSGRVMRGGLCNYLTDPIVLLELAVIAVAVAHWIGSLSNITPRLKKVVIVGLASGLLIFAVVFLYWLPALQRMANMRAMG
jgi:hypothetical protein